MFSDCASSIICCLLCLRNAHKKTETLLKFPAKINVIKKKSKDKTKAIFNSMLHESLSFCKNHSVSSNLSFCPHDDNIMIFHCLFYIILIEVFCENMFLFRFVLFWLIQSAIRVQNNCAKNGNVITFKQTFSTGVYGVSWRL